MTLLYSIPGIRGGIVRMQTVMVRQVYRKWLPNDVTVYGCPIIAFTPRSRVTMGSNLVLISNSYFSGAGVNHPCVLRTLRPEARLKIGDNVGMSGCTVSSADSVSIGDNCLLGANALITDTDFHAIAPENRRWCTDGVRAAPVSIGDNVFIGANAIVLKGVKIGNGVVIGAGSVVTADIPANAIAVGVPARVIRVGPDAQKNR